MTAPANCVVAAQPPTPRVSRAVSVPPATMQRRMDRLSSAICYATSECSRLAGD
jgi:hypothetical protein